ncbi:unnamed protein product [Brachionus calyciflorus]|uniref:Uncharacterized protein n=1 Tax=Brachionus calyciflorus TaxID=104777 RepID=A0A814MK58_9BILA|nr:unnamed protein product [Brachionus calyciflorus]
MPRIIYFPDDEKLIAITVRFMREKNLKDLEGGYRPKNYPFEQITSIYSQGNFESGAPASLYSKWKKNYNNFRTRVLNSINEKSSKIFDDPMDNYEIVLDQNEWNKINKTIEDERKMSLSYDNVRKMNSQHRHRFQLDHDMRIDSYASKNIFDSLLPANGLVKMWEMVRENNPIWFFDATGNIMTKLKNQKEILLYTILAQDKTKKTSFPVADFLSSANDSISIYSFLNKIIEKFSLFPFFQKPKLIVTDFSWANIHAISKSFNNMEIIDYIVLTFKIMVEAKFYMRTSIKTLIYLCSTHFLKNIIDESDKVIRKNASEDGYQIRKRFIKSFILLQNCDDFEKFCKLLISIKNVFLNKKKDQKYLLAIANLTLAQKELDFDFLKNMNFPPKKENNDAEEIPKIFFVENKNINYVNDSPFTEYFKNLLESNENQDLEKIDIEENLYYNPDLFRIITKRLHILPLWSAILFRNFELDKTRYSNNAVERWFGYFKNKILMTNKRSNKQLINVEQSKASTEKYSFKYPRKTKISHYSHGYNFINNESYAVQKEMNKFK